MMTVMDKGAEQRLEEIFYQSIGSAISSWAAMESPIVAIASVLLETSLQKAGLVFYSMNFHAWLSVVDELFLLDENYGDKRSEWTSICKRLTELNDIRVRLAHHTSLERDKAGTLPSLRAPRFDVRRKSQKHAPLDTGQILRFIADVGLVQKRLSDLFEELVSRVRT
jgi:hypothetical protein